MMDAARPFEADNAEPETLGQSLAAETISSFVDEATASPVSFSPAHRTGLRALVDSAVVSHERLPMLDVVLDRFVRTLTTSMRNFTSDNIQITIERVYSARFSDFLQDISNPSLLSVVHAPEWENYALIAVDAPLTYAVVDALLGGRRYQGQPTSVRPFTSIETSLIKDMLGVISKDLSSAFAPITDVQFKIDRMETNPMFASIVQPSNICAVATIAMKMEDHGGTFQLLLPYVTIEPIREMLLQRFMGEKFGRDTIWEDHLAKEIRRTRVPLDAVLGEKHLRLGEVMEFQVGQVLPFSIGQNDPIDLRAGGVQLARGTIGRLGKNVAVKITSTEGTKK